MLPAHFGAQGRGVTAWINSVQLTIPKGLQEMELSFLKPVIFQLGRLCKQRWKLLGASGLIPILNLD